MNKQELAETISSMYKNAKLYRPDEILEVLAIHATEYDWDVLNGFHPKQSIVIEKSDEWFCGAKAEHFVVMTGYCNDFSPDFDDKTVHVHRDRDGVGYIHDAVLILANHNGLMHFTLFRTPPMHTLELN